LDFSLKNRAKLKKKNTNRKIKMPEFHNFICSSIISKSRICIHYKSEDLQKEFFSPFCNHFIFKIFFIENTCKIGKKLRQRRALFLCFAFAVFELTFPVEETLAKQR